MKITKRAYQELTQKHKELCKIFQLESQKKTKDLVFFQKLEKDIAELEKLISGLEVMEFSTQEPASVILGTKVVLESTQNGDTREYYIATRFTANPIKGIISYESPLGQKMFNLKLGNTFKFKDLSGYEETFKIKSIEE